MVNLILSAAVSTEEVNCLFVTGESMDTALKLLSKAVNVHVPVAGITVLEMERHHDNRNENEMADRNFHLAIARATGNSALVGVIEYLWNQRGSLWHKLKEHFQTEELRKQTLLDHRAILEAIAAHDANGAKQAMRAHLDRVSRTFSRG